MFNSGYVSTQLGYSASKYIMLCNFNKLRSISFQMITNSLLYVCICICDYVCHSVKDSGVQRGEGQMGYYPTLTLVKSGIKLMLLLLFSSFNYDILYKYNNWNLKRPNVGLSMTMKDDIGKTWKNALKINHFEGHFRGKKFKAAAQIFL